MNYISMLNGVDPKYHRSPIIIHDGQWIFAEFNTIDQFEFFARTLGFTYELTEERQWLNTNMVYRKFSMSHVINNHESFWKTSDVPADAKPIKAVSNGSIVTCYFTNDGKTITMYRPNPNAKEVYNPLSIEEHRAHKLIYGSY